MIQEAIAKTTVREDLSEQEMADVMEEISAGQASAVQIGALLVGLLMKGETVDEITGAARVLRAKSLPVPVSPSIRPLLDVVGTGGDGTGTFNISTTTALVAAACGITVAKHGNRCVSSSCGAADVLEALGVNLELTPEDSAACIEQVGIGFLFAPLLHPAMRNAVLPRKEIRVKSIFNLVGPLTNPAGADSFLMGVYRPGFTENMARVLRRLGCRSALIVHGEDGCDEITITGPTRMTRLLDGRITSMTVSPEDFGLKRAGLEEVRGGEALYNADITRRILEGEPGPRRDTVLMNAAAALMVSGRVDNLEKGLDLAAQAIDSGRARQKLAELAAVSQELAARRKKAVGE